MTLKSENSLKFLVLLSISLLMNLLQKLNKVFEKNLNSFHFSNDYKIAYTLLSWLLNGIQ